MTLGSRAIAVAIGTVLGLAAFAQWDEDFLAARAATASPGSPTVAGDAAADLLPGNGTGFGYALRFGGVVPGSENVSVDGRLQLRSVDYNIDYPSGTLTFAHPVRDYQGVQVSYRHAQQLEGKAQAQLMPLAALRFGETSGIRALYSMGGAERLQDGTILQRSSYGMSEKFALNSRSSMQGFYFFSSQRSARSSADPASPDQRRSALQASSLDRFISQSLNLAQGGFHGGVSYQDIGSKFNGFDGMQDEGVAADQIARWQKERGINRLGYNYGYGSKGSDFTTRFNRITDGSGSIVQRGLDFKTGGASLYWNTQRVDSAFRRFQDLGEADAGQWAKEHGISRQNLGGALSFGGGGLKFDQNAIDDGGGKVERSSVSLDTSKVKLSEYSQSIGAGFSRFNDIAEGDRGQWARERGYRRSGFSLSLADPFKRKNLWDNFAEDRIRTDTGDLVRRNMSFAGREWGAKWLSNRMDAGFSGLGNLRPDEQDAMIHQVRQSYNEADTALDQNDRVAFLREAGISRDYRHFGLTQKWGSFGYDALTISDNSGDIGRSRFSLTTKKTSFSYLDQRIAVGFARLGDLLPTERALYANETGLRRRQLGFATTFGKASQLNYSDLGISGDQGGLQRRSLGIKSGKYEFQFNQRRVDDNFTRAADLADPEKTLLSELRGFNEFDISGKFQLAKNFSGELFRFGADNPTEGISRNQTRFFVDWSPDKKTEISHLNDRLLAQSPTASLSDYLHEKTSYARDLGHIGKVSGYLEREYSGGLSMSGVDKTVKYRKYEGSPIKSISLVQESLETIDSAGNREFINVESFAGKVSKRMTLSLSDKTINRDEKRADEQYRGYGLSYDLGKGTKLDWQYTRALNSSSKGREIESWALSQTALGNLRFSGAYNEDRTDATNTKSGAQFGLGIAKPFRLGPLSNTQFSFGYLSQAQATVWQVENKNASASANLGKDVLGWTYGGIITPNGDRAVDRTYTYTMNPDPKRSVHFNMTYKARTLPGGIKQMIRAEHLDYKLGSKLTLVHDLNSNPDHAQQNVLLGTIINPTGSSNWALNMPIDKRNDLVGNYLTTFDDTKGQVARHGGVTLNMKTKGGLPLWTVGYGVEATNIYGVSTIAHTFAVGYQHTINPTNALSFTVTDTQFDHNVPAGRQRNSPGGKVDYTLRF